MKNDYSNRKHFYTLKLNASYSDITYGIRIMQYEFLVVAGSIPVEVIGFFN
jgi:hypothetical protein